MFTSVFDSVAGLCCAKDISYTRAWKQHTHSSQIVQTLDQMHETHNNNNNNDANL